MSAYQLLFSKYPNRIILHIKFFLLAMRILVFVAPSSCTTMSNVVKDESAGLNGGFEIIKSELPVNWYFYTSATIPSGSYNLISDSIIFKEGNRSLKFDVQNCSPNGGWYSPGCFQTVAAETGKTYQISFWLKNENCSYRIKIGSERPQIPGYHNGKTFHSKGTIPNWQQFKFSYTVPDGFRNIRFELNILQPGIFWLDDVKIEAL